MLEKSTKGNIIDALKHLASANMQNFCNIAVIKTLKQDFFFFNDTSWDKLTVPFCK